MFLKLLWNKNLRMKKSYQFQPALGRRILCWILPHQERETLLGDFDEIYKDYIAIFTSSIRQVNEKKIGIF